MNNIKLLPVSITLIDLKVAIEVNSFFCGGRIKKIICCWFIFFFLCYCFALVCLCFFYNKIGLLKLLNSIFVGRSLNWISKPEVNVENLLPIKNLFRIQSSKYVNSVTLDLPLVTKIHYFKTWCIMHSWTISKA